MENQQDAKLPTQARVVIVGGGVMGCGLCIISAMKAGLRVLLEKAN